MVPISYYLVLAAALFCIGIGAFLIKRNIITVFMSIELMLNAVNLTFVAFSQVHKAIQGQIFVFFVIIAIFRTRQTLDVDSINLMKN